MIEQISLVTGRLLYRPRTHELIKHLSDAERADSSLALEGVVLDKPFIEKIWTRRGGSRMIGFTFKGEGTEFWKSIPEKEYDVRVLGNRWPRTFEELIRQGSEISLRGHLDIFVEKGPDGMFLPAHDYFIFATDRATGL